MSKGCGEDGSRSGHGPKMETTYETNGECIIFNVPLIPGETTIVSWKKLMNKANLTTGHKPLGLGPSPVEDPSSSSAKQSIGKAGYSHLSEEGGVGSGDEDNIGLGNMPDEDEYDNNDSFIDDSEQNEYFMVNNSKFKPEEFFVHHGKLMPIEPIISIVHHGRKRKHGDMLSDTKPKAYSLLYNDPPRRQRIEGSLTSMVEVAIKELENAVVEFGPSTTQTKDLDHSSQAIKKRLSPEIKQRLAKVAELTEDSNGKVPKDVINRMMGIVGHLIHVRMLKRNLKVMADMKSLEKLKKEKQVLKIKKEVADLIRSRIHKNRTMVEQQGPEDWEDMRCKRKLGKPLENKIHDLYELFLERQDDTGPSLIRVYNELASLWPAGFMNFDRIRRAIDRAKRRR